MATTKPDTNPTIAVESNFPGEALDTAIAAARIADPIVQGRDGRLHAFVPEKFRLTELPDDTRLAPWPKAHVVVDERTSLSAYANRHSDERSILIADFDKVSITAHLNWHPSNETKLDDRSGPNSHRATLQLRHSEEFQRWDKMEGDLHPQDEFARFLEVHGPHQRRVTPDPRADDRRADPHSERTNR